MVANPTFEALVLLKILSHPLSCERLSCTISFIFRQWMQAHLIPAPIFISPFDGCKKSQILHQNLNRPQMVASSKNNVLKACNTDRAAA